MVEPKPNYTDLVHQVVQESIEPLPFAEIVRRVNDLLPISTSKPKNTIRNAITQSRLIVHNGEGAYSWFPRIINGSVIRLPLSEENILQRQIIYSDELRDVLWPTFFEIKKRSDRSPIHLQLFDGVTIELELNFLGAGVWGTSGGLDLWDWLGKANPKPGDCLIFRVLDGEARRYRVEFEAHTDRDEKSIAKRNQQIFEAVFAYSKRNRNVSAIWEISPHLLAAGLYQHPVPPDPLVQILKDVAWEPDVPDLFVEPDLFDIKKLRLDPLISSLLDQIGELSGRRSSKKGLTQPSRSHSIYQLKVTLEDIRPPIWRRIRVPGDITLPQLHSVLQIAVGWTNSHLHGFKVGGEFFSEPSPDFGMKIIDERRMRLSQIAPEVGSRFIYEYDFGDSWSHLVAVELILPSEEEVLIQCLDGKRACPPEDVGGPHGYEEFLEVMRNPGHPEYTDRMMWAGGRYHPGTFDLQRVNDLLKSLQKHLSNRV